MHQESINLSQVLALALMENPELKAYSFSVRASEARMLQAGLLPNPEIAFEVESYGRDGAGFDSAESSVVLGQVIELGGKRRKRVRVAEAAGELSGWDYESKRLDVFALTAQRFVRVVAAQRRVELAESFVALSEQTLRAVEERVDAGKETPAQATKAAAWLEVARLSVLEAENNLEAARKVLATSWGAEQPHFTTAVGGFGNIPETLPAEENLRRLLASNPALARGKAELELGEAVLDSARADGVPDVRAMVGYQRFEEDGTDALTFGFGVPLPLFDRNQGQVSASAYELEKIRAERQAVEAQLVAELARNYARLSVAQRKARVLRSKIVPAMEQVFDAAQESYREGKFGFLDVLDGQRSLFAVRSELIDAMADFRMAQSDLERLTGTGMDEILKNTEGEVQ